MNHNKNTINSLISISANFPHTKIIFTQLYESVNIFYYCSLLADGKNLITKEMLVQHFIPLHTGMSIDNIKHYQNDLPA